ncbi:MAG: sigma-70 family RNA polymerase sigma factor [Gemmataceae bacterium]|nr:sigma-70 family RNA polymerase sigma factor [Gemmataceae bacterium]
MADESLRVLLHGLRRLADHSAGGLGDAELLQRFLSARDQAAFEVLVWRHGPLVLGVCRRLLRQTQDIEDAFQATFLALVRKAGSISKRAAVASWLYKVAYRIALAVRSAAIRRADREQEWTDQPIEPGPDEVLWRDLRPVLDQEVMALPEKYRAPFVLCCLEGKTNDEAARQLGCARGTLLSRLARARERLRVRLARRGVTLTAGVLTATAAERGLAAVSAELATTSIRAVLSGTVGQAAVAVSARVAALTEGVLQAMFLTKVKTGLVVLLAVVLLGAGALGSGVFAGAPGAGPAGDRAAPGKQKEGAPAGQPKPDDARLAALRVQSANNLKYIGLALHGYHDVEGKLPAPAIYSKDGKPLLSWRVAILPYLDQGNLYRKFKLAEPWDSEHNKKLLQAIPKQYVPVRGPSDKVTGGTYYQAFVGQDAAFEPGKQLRLADIVDGTSNTLFIVEAEALVPWTKPQDLPYVANQALPRLGGQFEGKFHGLMGDGAVLLLKKDADEKMLRLAISRADGNPIDFNKLAVPPAAKAQQAPPALPNDLKALRDALDAALQEAAASRDQARALALQLREQLAVSEQKVRQLQQENDTLRLQLEQARRQTEVARAETAVARAEAERLRKLLEKRPAEKKQ